MGQLLRGKRVGFLGYGQVARSLHTLLKPFEVEVFACDPALDSEAAEGAGVHLVSLDQLFSSVDVLSVHLPGGDSTRGLVGRAQLERLPPRAIFVNTARGGVVDEAALLAWLRRSPASCAYLDVYAAEPYSGPLAELDNVVMTPHIGSYAREGRAQMEMEAVENLLAVLVPA
jgi:D-3-phosphoglycerate dehydrogenase